MSILNKIYDFIDPFILEDDKEIDIMDYTYEAFDQNIGRYCKKEIQYPLKFIYPDNNRSSLLFLHFYKEKCMKDNIKKIKDNKTKFTIIRTFLIKDKNKSNNHHIIILYIKKNDTFYILDPSGASIDYEYYEEAKNLLFENYIIVKSMETLQGLEGSVEDYKGEIKGYCIAWSYFFIRCYIINNDEVELDELIDLIISACNRDRSKLEIMMRRLIRNYTYECIYG